MLIYILHVVYSKRPLSDCRGKKGSPKLDTGLIFKSLTAKFKEAKDSNPNKAVVDGITCLS